ncbi:recombinase family protein [Bengtsoniella intestinalis]|uniref:recombinase family protein n=1 Tax=Bengtsoniella intestinalis TaxID=3073143 RepID=UPI00391F084F
MTNQTIVGTSAKREIIHIEATIQTNKLRVAGYCRVSSDSSDQLNSFAAQVSYYTNLIEGTQEWEMAGIYADEGITGVSMDKREDFLRMLADCREGKIDRIITKSTSRFSRNTLDSLATVRELKDMGVSVYFEKESIDTAVLTGENLLTLYALFAQEESLSISRNCKKGNRMRMAQGTYVSSNPPYGYRLVNKQLEIYEPEAQVVQMIFGEYLKGKGTKEIAKMLMAQNAKNKNGTTIWSHRTILIILKNERYKGDMRLQKSFTEDMLPYRKNQNRGELPQYYVRNTHDGIVSSLQYEIVNMLMDVRADEFIKDQIVTTLSKSVYCKECGAVYRRKINRGVTSWVCRRHDENINKCNGQLVSEEKIYAAFVRMYNKLQANQADILIPMITALKKLQEQGQRGNHELQTINKKIAELSEQNHRMSGLLSSGILDSALFISKTDELKKQLKDARQAKARMLSSLKKDTCLIETEDLLETLKEYPTHITTMDEEIFTDIVDKILAQDNQTIDFVLKNGLVLTERL